MEVMEKEGLVLSIAENGYGKRTDWRSTPADARRQGRHQYEDDQEDRQRSSVLFW